MSVGWVSEHVAFLGAVIAFDHERVEETENFSIRKVDPLGAAFAG